MEKQKVTSLLKRCKRCGCSLTIMQGRFCYNCLKLLPLREQLREQGWKENAQKISYKQTGGRNSSHL